MIARQHEDVAALGTAAPAAAAAAAIHATSTNGEQSVPLRVLQHLRRLPCIFADCSYDVSIACQQFPPSYQDEIAVIRIDNPPVNALSNEVIAGLHAEMARAAADPAARGIVIVGAGRTFVAGADIKGLEAMAWGDMSGAPDMHDALAFIEDCPKPVVMAMHGTALGGGLELAMAGHYRVATSDAKLGQPEVNLGIIPGAEGTQRLPRLVGVEKALEMCVIGTAHQRAATRCAPA